MIPALLAAMGVPKRRLDIVTPYFVISKAWSDVFASWTARGVELRMLTNSLAANDPAIAHAGYLVRRRALLLGGVQLLELKGDAVDPEIGDLRSEAWGSSVSGSAATLHAKTAAIDGRAALRRLAQPRSALRLPQHRDGHGDREPAARRGAAPDVRPAARSTTPIGSRSARMAGCAGPSGRPMATSSTTASRRSAWSDGSAPASSPCCRSTGCSEPRADVTRMPYWANVLANVAEPACEADA